ncbi:F-box only protein 9 [Eurytemora carolleeae]|uniref:F-box only protein 9 n=1 Tax=Eurytemora carolleeae TaxID=1294199 RepID=UPI000C75BBBA|nr:F-box only protein 9 [Eurytemora carolleeae]|eukprot:XP_023342188.1 F-box only protein 9-like [Eurytemora affinis]
MTYIREGERGFQDSATYKAWHVVEYYRFIRFFPGGRAMMVLSADDPGLIVKLMNNRNICYVQGAMFGEYRIVDDVLFCILNKSKPKKPAQKFRRKRRDSMVYHDVPDQEFLLEFYIKGPRFQKLFWRNYKILSKYSNGSEQLDIVNLNEKEFPRLVFSPVRSYHFESYSPL